MKNFEKQNNYKMKEKQQEKKQEKQEEKQEEKIEEIYYNTNSIASANDFTGLIPSAVECKSQSESYSNEFNMHRQKTVNFGDLEETVKKKFKK